jgi:hypothetical protein
MKKILALCLLATWALPAPAADSASPADAWAKALAPYLDENTFAVVHADLAKLAEEGSLKKAGELAHVPERELAVAKLLVLPLLQSLNKAGGKDLFVVVSMNDLPHDLPFALVPLEPGVDADVLLRVLKLATPFKSQIEVRDGHAYGIPAASEMTFEKVGSALVGGTPETLKRLKTLKPAPRPEVERALAAVGGSALQAIFVPPAHTRRLIEESMPTVPAPVNLPSSHFTRGALWASLGVDLLPTASARVVIQSQDAAAARNLVDLLVSVKKALGQWPEFLESFPGFPRMAELLTPRVEGDRLTLTLDEPALVATLQPLFNKSVAEIQVARVGSNLRDLGIAMHSYADVKKTFPAWASYSKEGKPLLSWRVHLLPFLGQEALYKEFHLDEPWDSEHNKKLIPRMPGVYKSPAYLGGEVGKTTFLVPLGPDLAFPMENKANRLPADFPDGTSNTILMLDVDDDRAVVWTRPADLEVNQNKPTAGLGNRPSGKFGVLLVDGSSRSFPRNIAPGNLWAWLTRNGGDIVVVP